VLPSLFVVAAAGSIATSAFGGLWFLVAYAATLVAFAASRAPRLGTGAVRLLAILPVLHVGYGLGFLAGALEILTGRQGKPPGAP
jgi:hypothetical protein